MTAQLYRAVEVAGVADGVGAGSADANNHCYPGRDTGAGAADGVVGDAAGDAGAASAVASAVGAGDAGWTAHANDTSPLNESYHDETASAWIQTLAESDFAGGTVQTWTAICLHLWR